MSLQALFDADRRLFVLQLLAEVGEANESVINDGCRAGGHRVTRRQTRDDLDWLAARRLVTLDYYDDTVVVAKLVERGLDVARGEERVAGVKRPSVV